MTNKTTPSARQAAAMKREERARAREIYPVKVGEVWESSACEFEKAKERILAEAQAQIEALKLERKELVARAIHEAVQAGVPKVALREVTTKDHYSFEGYVELGAKLAKKARSK
jgi:hypothetical protein